MHSYAVSALILPTFLVLLSLAGEPQQVGLCNGDFEGDPVGDVPVGWHIPKACKDGGYELEVLDAPGAGGKRCAALSGEDGGKRIFGNCMQSVDAKPFRGKRVRFSAAVRCEPADAQSRAQLWLRVDRPQEDMGFFDNMDDRPIRSEAWQRYEIVGDIAKDAESIALGMMLIGGGTAMLDDAVLEVVAGDVAPTGIYGTRKEGEPGLAVVLYEAKGHVLHEGGATSIRFPLPLAYRDQTPLTFRLALEPADLEAHVTIRAGAGPNQELELELRDVDPEEPPKLRYESVVLVAPSSFDNAPARAAFPATWPAEAAPWLAASWCCDSDDARIHRIGAEIKAEAGDVRGVVEAALKRSQQIFGEAKGRVHDLTAVEALDGQGSCTSCANLVAALIRAAGVPARILSGYPLWSGPLQTHYIVEAYMPDYGWYPVESTMGRSPWPNCRQVNVNIVPIENEAEGVAGQRPCAAGGVPFLTLTEYATDSVVALEGTLKPACDHEARQLRPMEAATTEWRSTQDWARERWAKWLESKPEIRAGKLEFGPASDALKAKTLAELRAELR